MKPEVSEQLFIEELFSGSKKELDTETVELKMIERLTGDASTRRYYRLFTNKNSYVACLDNPTERGENSFVRVQGFLQRYDVRVPRIYDRSVEKGYILEEDLGDITLLQYLSEIKNRKEEFEIYKKILDILLSIHKIPLEDVKSSGKFDLFFDEKKLNSEINFTTDFFIKRFLRVSDSSVHKKINDSFKEINSRLASEKMVLTHRDFHSRNIMVKEDDFIVIDFQDARQGIPQYDLVSILEDCYYELDSNNRYMLIEYYYNNLPKEVHGQHSYEEFTSLYNDMTLQRVFKAIGSFSYIYETRKDVRYTKYIGFAMEKIKRILFRDEKYNALREILFKYYYES
ncbi:MAG: phosphotransferase [Bacteriovoracaceae bacterium]|jgi:aminoglycoside/choline kinase family phosphotransferase|nr:hypothetical protein [Halobacteriovoraceae bacterium]MDP7321842.1 phosphotransferase [Bacteriovoracaceae bacterium]